MALLIDGYNLLHATGISGKGSGPGGFQRSREALLNFLAASIEPAERAQTTIVFDAADAPPGLPRTMTQEEMTVRYATDYPDADTLIEELISEHSTPRKLLVVSSDHRIQRGAKHRRLPRNIGYRVRADRGAAGLHRALQTWTLAGMVQPHGNVNT